MADYEGNGLAAFNDARSRGWGGSVTLADLERLSAGNPIAHGIAAVWPDAPPSRMDQAYQTSIDRWKQLGKDAFFAPANSLKAFMDQPTFNNALGVMPIGGIGKMPIMPPTGIRAYHGSPYDFDRFDISKIGTGEGAQSYGHGLYFAENQKVAEQYRDAFKGGPLIVPGNPFSGAETVPRSSYPRMYEVNINAKPEQFLDWDRPLRQMSPEVQNAVRDLRVKDPLGGIIGDPSNVMPTGQETYRALARDRVPAADLRPGFDARSPHYATEALRDAGIPGIRYFDQGSRLTGSGNVERLVESHGSPEKAMEFAQSQLNKFDPGRPTHKYWTDIAQELKDYKPRTSNYVLFNDKIVDIMKKWSLAGAIPFAAASDYDGRY